MTVIYVTKYALTEGPFKVENAEVIKDGFATYKTGDSYMQYAHGKDFWLTPEEALSDCERRRQVKIKSIEKQKLKLENLEFEINNNPK